MKNYNIRRQQIRSLNAECLHTYLGSLEEFMMLDLYDPPMIFSMMNFISKEYDEKHWPTTDKQS